MSETAARRDWIERVLGFVISPDPAVAGLSLVKLAKARLGTEAIELAHDRGLPFASGVSGTTNILLHLRKHQADNGADVDATDFLLSSAMFLVDDGGHSVHEVMWTANQLDGTLGLGLGIGIGDPTKPNEFVSDYDGIAAKLGGETATAFKKSMDDAWNGTQTYLEDNSYFATPPEEDEGSSSELSASRH